MAGHKRKKPSPTGDLGGILNGFGNFVEKLAELAEKGQELRQSGELRSDDGTVRGVYGFNVKMGIGGQDLEVEPFGNVGPEEDGDRVTVHEVREPMVDVFEEEDCVLVVAEMPGVGQEDIELDLQDDILTIRAEREEMQYRKEVLLPAAFAQERMSASCRNGVLKVRFTR